MKPFFLLSLCIVFTACAPRSQVINQASLIIGPEMVACPGNVATRCFQIKDRFDADWTIYEGEIVGFTFEEGVTYEVMVRERRRSGRETTFFEVVSIISEER